MEHIKKLVDSCSNWFNEESSYTVDLFREVVVSICQNRAYFHDWAIKVDYKVRIKAQEEIITPKIVQLKEKYDKQIVQSTKKFVILKDWMID